MNYRSIADMARLIRENSHLIPADVDLVVGIPRSGMLAASILGLTLNLKVTDLQAFVANTVLCHGNTRVTRFPHLMYPAHAKHVLLVDDSISSGSSLKSALSQCSGARRERKVTTCAIFATAGTTHLVDLHFEVLQQPRAFEWNLMHRELLASCCVDIDGVLCLDPRKDQNDDGSAYQDFLKNVPPSFIASHPIGDLVTSRLERYRAETEEWLVAHNIQYRCLHMLDVPDAEARRRGRMHASFKASVYSRLRDSVLFIESDPVQSREIARLSGKPVLCYRTQEMLMPPVSVARIRHGASGIGWRLKRKLERGLRRFSGR